MLEPSPERIARVADHPGAPWQVLPYERQLEVKAEQVDDALRAASGSLDDFEIEPIVPAVEQWRYRNKLEYSFGTDAEGELGAAASTRPAAGTRSCRWPTDMLAVARRSTSCAAQVLRCRDEGLTAWDRRDHRGFLRNLVMREGGAPGRAQVALVTSPGKLDVDGFIDAASTPTACGGRRPTDLGESTGGGESTLAVRRAGELERGAQRPALLDLARGVFPDEHRDGGAALRRRPRVRRPARARDACSTSTAGSARSALDAWPPARRKVSGLEIVEAGRGRRASRTPSSTRSSTRASSPATRAWRCAELRREGRQARPRRRRPAARRPRRRRPCAGSIDAAPPRIVYVSCNPTTLAPNAAQLVEAGYRPAPACARWTCSRRRRTSSAWRCSRRARTACSNPDREALSVRSRPIASDASYPSLRMRWVLVVSPASPWRAPWPYAAYAAMMSAWQAFASARAGDTPYRSRRFLRSTRPAGAATSRCSVVRPAERRSRTSLPMTSRGLRSDRGDGHSARRATVRSPLEGDGDGPEAPVGLRRGSAPSVATGARRRSRVFAVGGTAVSAVRGGGSRRVG